MAGLATELGVGAMKFMVGKLIQHVKEQNELISNAPNQVDDLERDINYLNSYLTDDNRHRSDSLFTTNLLREVGVLVYKAEDAIDDFVAQSTYKSESWWFSRALSKSKKAEAAEQIKSVCDKVKEIRKRVEDYQINKDGQSTENKGGFHELETTLRLAEQDPRPDQIFAPIFEEKEKILRKRLTEEAEQPHVIFVTGMHGIGKTTLAAKMFHDSDKLKFNKRIWVSVSDPKERHILLVVLRKLNIVPDPAKNDWELSQQVADCLKDEEFLIVLDNISEFKDWGVLKNAFKKGNIKSKVLITSINDEIAPPIVRHHPDIKLNTLSKDESWTLLQWRVFSGPFCPKELEIHGNVIARTCDGLPQKIAFAGNMIVTKDLVSDGMSRRQHVWENLAPAIANLFNNRMGAELTSMLSSYNRLPYHLKVCFLYLGIFPQSKFSVSKLIRLWIAEGFIQPSNDVSLEKTAEDHLESLVNLNLVKIEETRSDGSAKTCSMNSLWYDFCKNESGNTKENFFQEFRKSSSDGSYVPPINKAQKNRRVCIHDHVSKFITTFISPRYQSFGLRSFVSHSKEEITLRSQDISNLRATFKLLRVLDAKPMKFNKIHSDLCLLVHLRFVTLSLNGDVLPAAISKLRNIQTLIVHTMSHKLEIKADILKMDELRHFKTNASATLPKKSASEKDERLQTLCGISPKSCTQEFFDKTPNLKKLGIHGQLALLLPNDKSKLLSNLREVEKLKLLNHVTSPNNESDLSGLIEQSRFPPNLRSLTLSATCLKWEDISILGLLQKLEELKLKDNAFVGEKWEVSGNGFPHLKTLHIEGLDFEQWKSSSGQFRQLRRLVLFECKKLREIPIELADIRTFQELQLHKNHISAAEPADRILDRKLQLKKTESSIVFKLVT